MKLLEMARRGARLAAAHATGRAVPFHVTLQITNRCNLRCVYCSCPDRRNTELTTAQWTGIMDQLRGLGTERVIFSGGEPLVRNDVGELVAHARRLGLATAMTSNGTLVPRREDAVRRLDTLVLSLDGARVGHDANRGSGSHADVLRAFAAARSWRVPLKVNAVLSANNSDDAEWLFAFARRQQVPITLNVMRSEPNGLYRDAEEHRLTREGLQRLVDRILAEKRRNPWIVFSSRSYERIRDWPDPDRDRLRARDLLGAEGDWARCSAGRFHAHIYPDGRVFPCVITVEQVDALKAHEAGVAAALAAVGSHDCMTCNSACMQEVNALFDLEWRAAANLAGTYLRHQIR